MMEGIPMYIGAPDPSIDGIAPYDLQPYTRQHSMVGMTQDQLRVERERAYGLFQVWTVRVDATMGAMQNIAVFYHKELRSTRRRIICASAYAQYAQTKQENHVARQNMKSWERRWKEARRLHRKAIAKEIGS